MNFKISRAYLPISINKERLNEVFLKAKKQRAPVIAVVTATKPDFYKQAPLVVEAAREGLPVLIINTGQHFDEVLGFGIKEFGLEKYICANLQVRGDLLEKASELMIKLGAFGRYCAKSYPNGKDILPIVHGDTLVAGIGSLAWVFGVGRKVGQNEAGLRSMAPEVMKKIKVDIRPSREQTSDFINEQLYGKWFRAREEPFPEQIDTWVGSAGTKYFFAPTKLNRDNLINEGYPEEDIFVVGNSVVDAIKLKRKEKSESSVFDIYPKLESGEWMRVDIHRRENLTQRRFHSVIGTVEHLVRETDHKIVLVMLTATNTAVKSYGLENRLKLLEAKYPGKFVMTPLWKEYAHVIEFLDSGHCWAELTDSGSMQEELLYFPKVLSLTVRLNTDRPETVFDSKSNILVPPVSKEWMMPIIEEAYKQGSALGIKLRKKKQIYGKPGEVSKKIVRVLAQKFGTGNFDFYPWLHGRLNLWKEEHKLDYL
jgi:UDP-N-acetylglucosamine 2-epimerase